MRASHSKLRTTIRNNSVKKEVISRNNFINLIFKNIINKENNNINININNTIIYQSLSIYKPKIFSKIFFRTFFISKTEKKYKNFKYNKHYLSMFINIIVFLIEEKNKNLYLIENCFAILIKLYKQKIIDNNNMLIIIKFIILLSIYDRADCIDNELSKNKIIKKYEILKYTLKIIKQIDDVELSKEYINFINNNIIKYKVNLFFITSKTDFLELINLKNNDRCILDFLANIYSFKYSKNFLDVFMKQIKDVYDINNKTKSTIDILKYLKTDLYILKTMQENELKKYNEDPFILSNGFVINNNSEKTSAIVKEIIIKGQFTMVFSFCYSPDEKKNINDSINKNKIKKKNRYTDNRFNKRRFVV